MVLDLGAATLGQVLADSARRVPDRPALVSEHRTWTYAQLDRAVNQVAHQFSALGIGPGQAVGFITDKRPEVVIGFLACARIGAIFAPVNFKLHEDHVRDQVRTSVITALVVEQHYDTLTGALLDLIDRERILSVGPPSAHALHRMEDAGAQPDTAPSFSAMPETVCYYNYTSGTTGRPKGAITTHRNILQNAVDTIEALGFREDDVFLGMFSVFAHPHELFHRSIVLGGTFAILDSLSPRVIAQAIERHAITWMMAVPSFYEMLLDHRALGGGQDGFDLRSLRVLESGGAYVGADMLRRMEEAFEATFLPVWGCTEATGVGLAMPVGAERRPGSTGRPVQGYEVRVVDPESGEALPRGQVGELVIRGPSVVEGYVNQPEETEIQFVDGWYHTRDLVSQDDDGFIHFAGRISEMLKIGGIRVYPLEIETAVKAHPDVREVVVVRHEERLRGEIARCCVELQPGSTLDRRALQAWCRDRLANYKVPRLIEFWEAIPRLPNGKVNKKEVALRPADPERDERR